jgi:putative endopeptidase
MKVKASRKRSPSNKHNKTKKGHKTITLNKHPEEQSFNTFKGSLLERKRFKNNESVEKIWKRYRQYVKELKSTLKSSHLMKKSDVKNDFYTYINVDWLGKGDETKEEKKFYVQIDDFRITQEKVYYELIGYVKTFEKENPNSLRAKAISNVYNSFYNASQKVGLKHAQTVKGIIEASIDSDDMYSLLAHISMDEVVSWQCPIVWSVIPDEKNVTKYISHLDMPQLGIYDYMIYVDEPSDSIDTKKFKREFKEKYLQFIHDTFKAILPDEYRQYNPIDVWNVEVEILDAMGCNKYKNVENEDYYNVVTKNELENKYGFDWTDFTKKLGYKKAPEKIIVSSVNGIACITELLKKKWKTHEWKTYWLFIYYKQFIRSQWDWYEIYFNFYEKYVQGKPVRFPREIYPIFILSFCFNTFLTEQYVAHNLKPQSIEYVRNMVNDFRKIFINKISRNTWLSPSTKRSALKKLKHLKAIIGYPDQLREDPILNYCNDDPWMNVKILTDWKHKKTVELEGMDVGVDIPSIDWNEFKLTGTQAYVVNAYYTPTSNSIYLPLAYLQKPFLDLDERGIEYNLAYVGQTITHELSHCLDDMGSRFDEKGNLNNWWTDRDRKRFKAKIKDVVDQYTEFARRDGINFDASIGVGENLADISGLSLAEEYLLLFQQANEDIDIIKKISLEAFYVYCAIQSRQKIYSKAIPAQLKTNPHPLEKYRCNCPLTRLEIFREIYDIKKGDKMWWHNTDTIW